ncbi:hypothetical protein BpHYR1_006100 [Brachionus plicatilis]|uniref:Uncharacterized protein n=1 Tax=Brachionus plicatilis TaxID=10195 RepID=A0A3M7SFL2_BRAPC|nr:hypothetical protein BpHYR1_006100 [Brachionus plicatilis]
MDKKLYDQKPSHHNQKSDPGKFECTRQVDWEYDTVCFPQNCLNSLNLGVNPIVTLQLEKFYFINLK